jgi:outer membrane biosynthesis protein TonB
MGVSVVDDEDDLQLGIEKYRAQIKVYLSDMNQLNTELQPVEAQLESISDERAQYEVLSSICDNLDALNDIGGNELFWSGLVENDQIDGQLTRLRDQASFFERRIKKITDAHEKITAEIKNKKDEIDYFQEEIGRLIEREEESKHEYLIERELRPVPYRVAVMPWTKKGKDEKKYHKILLLALLISLLLGGLIPLYNVPIPDRDEVVKIPERLAKLVKKQKPKPKPKPKQEQVKKEEKKPTKEEKKKARKKVKNKGVLAFKNNLANLLDDVALDKLGANANLSNAGSTARNTRRSIITSQATSASGGINSTKLSRNTAGTGDQIDAVAFSRVDSAIGVGVEDDRPLSSGPGPSRTDEEIQIVFDKYKAALYRIYNRELRVNPSLQGKVVLRITIQPDGSVSLAKVESTDMDARKMLKGVVDRVKRFNFGAKEGVPQITILYPIDFLPSS